MKPTFFATPAAFRAWLEAHHESAVELWVGFHKRASGTPSITWPESVDAALCYGWIDGLRKSLDENRYVIRFTPRRPGSIWSSINVKRVAALTKSGLMRPAGKAAFARKKKEKSGVYSFEQKQPVTLDAASQQRLEANPAAWKYFQSQAPWYRRTASFWVMSAKKAETRERRLQTLIADSAEGRTIKPLTRSA
jgi:uncharacterized protein YdeI (YjbR/CyaY-like superfamily)